MIDKIMCLCLDKRKGMWDALAEDVYDVFDKPMERFICGHSADPDLEYDYIDETEVPPNQAFAYGNDTMIHHYNAYCCHKAMAYKALDSDCNNVLFLEDDALILTVRAHKILEDQRIRRFIKSEAWDIIYLGWWLKDADSDNEDGAMAEELWATEQDYDITHVPHPPIVAHEICALHGLLISKNFLPIIAHAPYGPIDSYLGRHLDQIKAFYMWPKIIHVHSGFSYCEGSHTERNIL